ncbi:carbamoyltransferase HypF [Ruminiclostridium papyrosolvens]|uniref:Carbamoyltransferase n=1 Tax=Ruminiclostridium papyrosolvens C7 TaxID=1330534 RepID=U4QYL4_9FIRM|nr:carbamoyltransferase HypF [Ruminiclostridium papyrosolvens]EPR08238.1 hydrogenase maturation protein HypF [Ruminiclostridium papyrosolvens C7]
MTGYRIIITGIVQGVGFRPFIFNLAESFGLKGWVGNSDSNVIIEIDGDFQVAADFIGEIKKSAPVLSVIESIEYNEIDYQGFRNFQIRHSQNNSKGPVFISPDVATCCDCLREMKDKRDRRYKYPFINCTNCGPRFTIIKNIPYDRDKTTMACFEMCENCGQEYTKPSDRRYHAQPVSCHDCGPSLSVADETGKVIHEIKSSSQCIGYTADMIKKGYIVAVKGIGGYHLACDGLNKEAVDRLRTRKHRDDKPFAVMAKDLKTAEKYCTISPAETSILNSPASPIVLLEKIDGGLLPDAIAHLNRYLGVMLPYTPVHHLLFEEEGFPELLVMTSGNLSSEPIFYRDEEAIEGLQGIADAYLTNNREIYIRTDDSVTRVFKEKEYIIRRARGYVPKPVSINVHELLDLNEAVEIPSVLACGGELKNVFCLNKGKNFYLSHHIGDLENESTNIAFRNAIEHFKRLFDISPQCIAYDLHPNYYSTQYALKQPNIDKIALQHHKAHIASCMAENRLKGDVIGVSFDGTGYGEDGNIWGGEFFTGGYYGFHRAGHMAYVMMPGSDSAVKHPWRMALSYLYASEQGVFDNIMEIAHKLPAFKDRSKEEIIFTIKMLEKRINSPFTSSMGRFFDGVSALLGIKTDISYEGQAAIELEYYADLCCTEPYHFDIENAAFEEEFKVNTSCIIKQIVNDILDGNGLEYISTRFHATIANIVLEGCLSIRSRGELNNVVLSGGVFQNVTLLQITVDSLQQQGFKVFVHSEVPANDGGIALGQSIMAIAHRLSNS